MKSLVDHRLTVTAATVVAVGWALTQFFENLVAVTMDENESFPCSLDQPKLAFILLTAGVCLAASAVLGFGLARRARPALAALGIEAGFGLAWVLSGGLDAAGCAIGI